MKKHTRNDETIAVKARRRSGFLNCVCVNGVDDDDDSAERPRQPCIITDAMDGWAANEEWTYEKLLARFATHKFKVGGGGAG